MHGKAANIFYGLSAFVLMTAVFVLQPAKQPEVTSLQTQIKQEFIVALKQTIGDQPWFTELSLMYEGINAFYNQAADASIALMTDKRSDQDIAYVFKTTWQVMAQAVKNPRLNSPKVAAVPEVPADKFMTEAAITNIVPASTGSVSGVSVSSSNDQPVNTDQPWVTMQDNFTGQQYCVAIYNGTVNKYLGACKFDYH